jgi:rhodanese-related sulfurtransferase
MTIPRITPVEAKERLDLGLALLVDIREPDEFAREHVPGALSVPLSRFDDSDLGKDRSRPVVMFLSYRGNRACEHFRRLASAVGRESYVVAGGMVAWKASGLPTDLDRGQPVEMRRQVMTAHGGLVLLGLLLALTVSPWFIVLTVLVGCELVFSGVCGWSGMAMLLRQMPWNASLR